MRMSLVVAALLLGWSAAVGSAAPVDETRQSLLSNGAFTLDANGDKWPDDWPHPDGTTWEKEGDTRFLRIKSSKPGEMIVVYRRADLKSPLPVALEVRLRLRYTDVKSGEKEWNDARVMGHFKNADGKVLKPEPETPYFRGSSQGWIDRVYLVKVPATAAYLELMPCMFQAAGGTLDLARCEVFAATAEQWAATQPKIVSSQTLVAAKSTTLPSELRVVGNQIKTRGGKAVWLQGLCLDSLQWSAAGEHLEKSVPVAIDEWKANVIRLPVMDHFWFGRGPWQDPKDGGAAYRKAVDAVIEAASSRGVYVVVDLHQFGAPMDEHVAFWKDVATRYKNHPAVLFELFNEAHSISWKLWRDGGNLEGPGSKSNDVNPAENKIELTGETSPGMQALLDAVRGVGAKNIVIVGGLDWGYDLSGVVDGYALKERDAGNGIVYSSHIYPWKSDWQHKTMDAAEKYPIFVGEVGCPESYKEFEFIPPAGRHPLEGWSEDVIALMQKHKLHWTGFSFHPGCGPRVISDWNYTPTPYWGAFVKDALSGKAFTLKKMR